jgi:bifunctional non-homologous end joining protein LigD
VRLWSRNGRDWTRRFVVAADALRAMPVDVVWTRRPCCRPKTACANSMRCAGLAGRGVPAPFDLLVLDGEDLRALPLDERRARLAAVLLDAPAGITLSEHIEGEHGPALFDHACRLGLEGIVSKSRESRDRPGRAGPGLGSDPEPWLRAPLARRPGHGAGTC